MNDNEKPPIGLMPSEMWEKQITQDRVTEILHAIDRYYRAGVEVPSAWIDELIRFGILPRTD